MKEWVVGVTVLGLCPMKGFDISQAFINLLAPELFYLILAHLYIKCE